MAITEGQTAGWASSDALSQLFSLPKPIIGTVHVRPLPGSPRYEGEAMDRIVACAISDADKYVRGGVDGLVIENEGDIPFLRPQDVGPETVAGLTAVAYAIKQAVTVPIGVNCLANAAGQSIAIAKAIGGVFIRANQWANAYIANEGFVEGAAAQSLRLRSMLRAQHIRVLADVHVKHGSHAIVADRSIAEQTRDVEFFDADVLIATGQRTSDPTKVEDVRSIKEAATRPVIVGSGLTSDNVGDLLGVADGAIVGSAMKLDGHWSQPVDPDRVARIMRVVKAVRGA